MLEAYRYSLRQIYFLLIVYLKNNNKTGHMGWSREIEARNGGG